MRGKTRFVVAAIVCVGVVIWMLTLLQKNVVYLKPVSEAVEQRDDQGGRRFRMGGAVVPGSIGERSSGTDFQVTEGGVTADVEFAGSPPELFQDCAPVVVEGHWRGDVFASDRLLIKHGSNYEPPKGLDRTECPDEPAGVRG